MARRVGQVNKRGENNWLVRVYLGTADNGKRDYHNQTVRGTKKDADKVSQELHRRRDAGEPLEESKHAFAAYADEWLPAKAQSLRSNTVENYGYLLTRYAFPKPGQRKLNGIEPTDIAKLYAEMARQGLSGATVQLLHVVLFGIFKQAIKSRLLRFNPLTAVGRPKRVRKEMQTLCGDEARALLAVVKVTAEESLFTFLLTTGCRPAEALGLKWSDLNFAARAITIQRTLKKKQGQWKCDPPQTSSGLRTITLPGEMLAQLRTQRRAQNEARLKIGQEVIYITIFGNICCCNHL